MRKGIYAFYGCSVPMKSRFEQIKKAGFDSVMIWWDNGKDNFEGYKFAYRSLAEKYDLYICNAHLPYDGCNNLWLETFIGDEYTDYVLNLIAECGEYQIPTAVIHVTKGLTPPPYNKTGIERLKRIVDAAEKNNVNMAFENLRHNEHLDYIFKNIKSPKVGFCYDSGHNNCYTPDKDVLEKYKHSLFALHLNDNMGHDDVHMLPFDGTANWDRTINTLKEIKYDGVLSFELKKDKHEKYNELSQEEYLALAFERAVRIEEKLKAGKLIGK